MTPNVQEWQSSDPEALVLLCTTKGAFLPSPLTSMKVTGANALSMWTVGSLVGSLMRGDKKVNGGHRELAWLFLRLRE